jgi:class 3 adenylate cyclase
MATQQAQHIEREDLDPPEATVAHAEGAASTRSTTLRAPIRVRRVYVEVREARRLASRTPVPRIGPKRRDTGRLLTTMLVTDIVDSTHTVARIGDRRWRELLARHYADCRDHVALGGGELVNTTGDGIVAIFDLPTHAVRAAIAIQASARESGMAVRAGVHTGECERLGTGLAGLSIHIAARICALGTPDEVLATATLRDLVIGSTLAFEPRGPHELRGVPGTWSVFAASEPAQVRRQTPGEQRGGRESTHASGGPTRAGTRATLGVGRRCL